MFIVNIFEIFRREKPGILYCPEALNWLHLIMKNIGKTDIFFFFLSCHILLSIKHIRENSPHTDLRCKKKNQKKKPGYFNQKPRSNVQLKPTNRTVAGTCVMTSPASDRFTNPVESKTSLPSLTCAQWCHSWSFKSLSIGIMLTNTGPVVSEAALLYQQKSAASWTNQLRHLAALFPTPRRPWLEWS